MPITLIGMSNIGKSHWAQKLSRKDNIRLFDCDALIGKELHSAIFATDQTRREAGSRATPGEPPSGIDTDLLAAWLSQPGTPYYNERSKQYLTAERIVLERILDELKTVRDPAFIDTTGSVIYLDEQILARLRAETVVVHLAAPDDHFDDLFRRFAQNPKPLIWGDLYDAEGGETSRQSITRSYPNLLRWRETKYRELAHRTVPYPHDTPLEQGYLALSAAVKAAP